MSRQGEQGVRWSDYIAVAAVEPAATVHTASDGDLWPSCWADDGALYAACGDGRGFSAAGWADIVVNRITGTPESGLDGERLASGRSVAPVWTDPGRFNSKPTGMVAVDGNRDGKDELYLAVQDLAYGGSTAFSEAPAIGIVRSDDHGRSWENTGMLFGNHVFTTIMFLDFGRSNARAAVLEHLPTGDGRDFVYAYGLDHNWRASYSRQVPDPVDLYLARVPVGHVQDRSRWEFFAGCAADGVPRWSRAIDDRMAVLHDERRRYVGDVRDPRGGTLISQGGVVYVPGLKRYVYTSWTEFTFEFFEAPMPWGPWRQCLQRDFGVFPWVGPHVPGARHGGYATTIPSKFLDPDGRGGWLQSNWFWQSAALSGRSYSFSLRRVEFEPYSLDDPLALSGVNHALPGLGGSPIATLFRSGCPGVLNDADSASVEDSWNGVARDQDDHWGVVWARQRWIDQVVFTHGTVDDTGGWFAIAPRIEIRHRGRWSPVESRVTPDYEPGPAALETRRYTFDFDPQLLDGVRVTGPPSGSESRTTAAELEAYLSERGYAAINPRRLPEDIETGDGGRHER